MVCRSMAGLLALGLLAGLAALATGEQGGQKTKDVWTDPKDQTLPEDFKVQGEYTGDGGAPGCQVIALGNGKFQAVLYQGGLPGAGWNGKDRSLLDGALANDKAVFTAATGKRKYLAQKPDEFSATQKFPPVGQKDYQATVRGDSMTLESPDGRLITMKKVTRRSPTLGKQAPDGALVLFNGKDTKEFNGGRLDAKTGLLNTDGKDITTKRKFQNYTVHLEFLLPFRPDLRGQGRGNSGFYMVDLYEVQILDSFGLEGLNNECGGVYTRLTPKVNACLPPLQWQTYDIDFTSATVDDKGKKVRNARITAKLNGIVIYDNVEIPGTTGGARNEPEGTPGVLRLQGHGNPLQFRNMWILEKK